MKRQHLFLLAFAMFSSLGYAQNLAVDYESAQAAQISIPKQVMVDFFNNDSMLMEISFGSPDSWLSVNETSFILNTTNTTRRHNVTVTITPYENLGTFEKKIPYTISYSGSQAFRNLVFSVNSIEPQTALAVEAFITDFSIPIFGQDLGVMKVRNNGSIVAFNVTFSDSMGWISFNPVNFSLGVNQSEIVEYLIKPNLTHTIETNITHNISIFVSSSNSEAMEVPIKVFIPFFDFGNLTCNFFWEQQEFFKVKKEFCDAHPTSPECLTSPVPMEINNTVYIKVPCNLENLTEADMNAYGVCRRDLEFCQNSTSNYLSTIAGNTQDIKSQGTNIIDNVSGLGGQFTFIIIFIGIVITAGIAIGFFMFLEKYRQQGR